MPIKVYRPSKNLGCLGFRIGQTYFDFHRTYWGWLKIQMFISSYWIWKLGLSKTGKGWLNQNGWKAMR